MLQFIIKRINAIISDLLWLGAKGDHNIHLVYLELIKKGSWGLKILEKFAWDLMSKRFCHAIFHSNIFHDIIQEKYLKNMGNLLSIKNSQIHSAMTTKLQCPSSCDGDVTSQHRNVYNLSHFACPQV